MGGEIAREIAPRQDISVPATHDITSATGPSRVDFIAAAIAEKKERLGEIAARQGFCADAARASLDKIPGIIKGLPDSARNLFVNEVATPLMAYEPLDLVKITLASRQLARLYSEVTQEGAPRFSFLLEKGVERLKADLLGGKFDEYTRGEMLPLPNRAIVYFVESEAQEHLQTLQSRLREASAVLYRSYELGALPENFLSSMKSIYVDFKRSEEMEFAGRVVAGYLEVVVEPHTTPVDLAVTLFHEDLHLEFGRAYGGKVEKNYVSGEKGSRELQGDIPLVHEESRTPEALLDEFHSYVKDLTYQHQLVAHGLIRGNDVRRFWEQSAHLVEDMNVAQKILEKCENDGFFTEKGVAVFHSLREQFAETKHRVSDVKRDMLKKAFVRIFENA